MANPADLVDKFVKLRDKIAELETAHKEAMKPYRAAMEKLDAALTGVLIESGANSLAFDTGTIFTTTVAKVTVEDWNATLDYIRANNAWDLLQSRVSTTQVQSIVNDTKRDVPGVAVRFDTNLSVRRPKET